MGELTEICIEFKLFGLEKSKTTTIFSFSNI